MTLGTSRTLLAEGTRAFVEVFAPSALLLVVGASHVSMPMVDLARVLGYRTVVIDGRPRFATRERFPQVDELKIGIPSELVSAYPLVPSTALVLMAHDYKYDLPVLHKALATDVGYIGMLGSSRRGAAILKLLAEEGRATPRSSASACRSASTSARARRPRSPWRSWPRFRPCGAAGPASR